MTENELSRVIIGYAIAIHTELGAGLLESVYQDIINLKKKALKLKKKNQ